jgi:hypothetical protein
MEADAGVARRAGAARGLALTCLSFGRTRAMVLATFLSLPSGTAEPRVSSGTMRASKTIRDLIGAPVVSFFFRKRRRDSPKSDAAL